MERGGSSNIEHRYTRRARASGIVIRERGAGAPTAVANPTVAANIPAGEVSREQQAAAFKREADQYMPIANVTRIMRRVLPTNAKIADDAKETIQECVSEFINFITVEANRRCHHDYRKTVTPEDVLAAMASLGFDDYLEPLSVFLSKHRAQDHLDRGSTSQLPQFVRSSSGNNGGSGVGHQPQAAQIVRSPPTTSSSEAATVMLPVGYYSPLPLVAPAATGEDEVEFGGFTQALNEYILSNPSGGEGSSGGGREFDMFLRSFN